MENKISFRILVLVPGAVIQVSSTVFDGKAWIFSGWKTISELYPYYIDCQNNTNLI